MTLRAFIWKHEVLIGNVLVGAILLGAVLAVTCC